MSGPADRLSAALGQRYAIERELGAGGMATVYLATDLRHDRKVALKLLRPELAAVLGADRFVQEIKTTAQLQHPHILPLFDSGSADGFLFYVMPFIEGETLRDKLNRETQLGIDEAVRITSEVADALDYAHRHGVIHRDIKPENVLLHDGRPMVADFGIALALSAAAGGRMTETGMSLGTPHYMSPEQATADKDIGPRSDVYSLASVLYEMLAGQPPHLGGSAQQIIMKIIAEPVEPVSRYRKSVPPNVAAALAKALEKLPADRFESAKAFAEALADPAFQYVTLAASSAIAAPPPRGPGRSRVTAWLPWGVAAAALAVAAWSLLRPSAPPAAPPAVRMAPSGFDVENTRGGQWRIAISRDGRTLVAGGPHSMLYVRRSDETAFRPIPGTTGARSPSISPDGTWMVFEQGQGLAKVLLTGGPVLPVADEGVEPDWYAPDSILYASRGGLRVVGAAGGVSRPVAGDTVQGRRPFMLPDRRGVLYEAVGGVRVLNRTTGKSTLLENGGSNPRYLPTGDVLYGDRDRQAVFAVPFDVKTQKVTGSPVPVLPSVQVFGGGAVQLAVSDNGTLVYVVGGGAGRSEKIEWIDTTGAMTPLPLAPGGVGFPRISHNGARIAYTDSAGTFVYNLTTGARTEVDSAAVLPVWSPSDSDVYLTTRGAHAATWLRVPVEGHGKPRVIATDMTGPMVGISPDGKWIVSESFAGKTAPDIYLTRTDSLPLHVRPYLRADWSETQPVVSPDGRWLAYVSNESDTAEVYIRSFPVPGTEVRVSTGRGETPMWAPHGSALYYASPKGMFRANLRLGSTISVLGRRRLFALAPGVRPDFRGIIRGLDISPDGSRFLTTALPHHGRVDTSATSHPASIGTTIVVVNWFSELKARMGAGGR